MNYKKLDTKKLAVAGSFCALIILMGVPGLHLGYLQLSPAASYTLMHIPVILATIFGGLFGAITSGLVFGLTSLVNSAANPSGALDVFFVNPAVSVVPRVLFALIIWGLSKIALIITGVKTDIFVARKKGFQYLVASILLALSAFLASVAHTVLVIAFLCFVAKSEDLLFKATLLAVTPNAIVESILAAVTVAVVLGVLWGVGRKKSKLMSELEKGDLDS